MWILPERAKTTRKNSWSHASFSNMSQALISKIGVWPILEFSKALCQHCDALLQSVSRSSLDKGDYWEGVWNKGLEPGMLFDKTKSSPSLIKVLDSIPP